MRVLLRRPQQSFHWTHRLHLKLLGLQLILWSFSIHHERDRIVPVCYIFRFHAIQTQSYSLVLLYLKFSRKVKEEETKKRQRGGEKEKKIPTSDHRMALRYNHFLFFLSFFLLKLKNCLRTTHSFYHSRVLTLF